MLSGFNESVCVAGVVHGDEDRHACARATANNVGKRVVPVAEHEGCVRAGFAPTGASSLAGVMAARGRLSRRSNSSSSAPPPTQTQTELLERLLVCPDRFPERVAPRGCTPRSYAEGADDDQHARDDETDTRAKSTRRPGGAARGGKHQQRPAPQLQRKMSLRAVLDAPVAAAHRAWLYGLSVAALRWPFCASPRAASWRRT